MAEVVAILHTAISEILPLFVINIDLIVVFVCNLFVDEVALYTS